MNRVQKFLLVASMICSVFFLFGTKAEASTTWTGASTSPTGHRVRCDSFVHVDFSVAPTITSFDTTTGVVEFNVNIRWQRCGTAADTRAYAVYASPDICPLSGWYGAGGVAHDCVKYIGNPAYNEPGSSLSCFAGTMTNGACVTSAFSGARKVANQPTTTVSPDQTVNIPMTYTIENWSFWKNISGSHKIESQMCQYYKTGASFSTHHIDSRCVDVSVTVSWEYEATYPIQTRRVIGSTRLGSTSFSSGQGTTTVGTSSSTSNPYNTTGHTGSRSVNASTAIPRGGRTYDRIGYTMCTNGNTGTDCTASLVNSSSGSITVNNSTGGNAGQPVNIWWHYNQRPRFVSLSATCSYEGVPGAARVVANVQDDNNYTVELVGTSLSEDGTASSSGRQHVFNVNSYRRFTATTFTVRITDSITGGTVDQNVVLPACATATCSISTPASPETGVPFTATVHIAVQNGLGSNAGDAAYTATLTASPGVDGAPQIRSGTIAQGTNTSTVDFTNLKSDTPGTYGLTATVSGLRPNSISCGDPHVVSIANRPFVTFARSDVAVGQRIHFGSCIETGPGSIATYNSGPGGTPPYQQGAGSQLGVFARGSVTEFVSAALRTSPGPPKGLTFANNNGAHTYGGNFGPFGCIPNYWDDSKATESPLPGGFFAGDRVISYDPDQKPYYHDGDLTIGGNVTYGGEPWSADNIPSLRVIVRGNIYIHRNVTQLDGIYIAVPRSDGSGTGGNILTCIQPGGAGRFSDANKNSMPEHCDKSLTINGSFIARSIKFLRTGGTVSANTPAEVFSSGPDTWIGGTGLGSITPGAPIYDSVVSLPPTL